MQNIRYANIERTIILADAPREMPDGSTQTDTLNIPVDERNAHYREMVLPFIAQGGMVADAPPVPVYVKPRDPLAEIDALKAGLIAKGVVTADDAKPKP